MSLNKEKGNFVFSCDNCPESLDTNTSNFESALSCMRQHGWHAVNRGTDDKGRHVWDHYDGPCYELKYGSVPRRWLD